MVDSPERANDIWSRLSADVPPVLDDRRAVGLNERLRFYRYGPGQRFAPHTDGCYRRKSGEESFLTLMIYLNGGARGGETRFENASITPAPGLALLFDHYLMHEGARVLEGQKYVLRSDVMYGPAGSSDVSNREDPLQVSGDIVNTRARGPDERRRGESRFFRTE